jgi:two-component system chemotaxis response regulator CheB
MSVAVKVNPVGVADPIKVMVVDDSAVVRGLVTRWIEAETDIAVVGFARTGREAVDKLERADPDVVILDIEMPELDGLSALPLLLAKKRDLVVIMASTLTRRGAEVSFKALALGAADYVSKPQSNRGITTSPDFRRELIERIRHLGARQAVRRRLRRAGVAATIADRTPAHPAHVAAPPVVLRASTVRSPRLLLIGASTGGPQALNTLMSQIAPVAKRVPVLIVQHMPPTFTTILAEHLARACGITVREPADGEPIAAGVVHVAPGGRHMVLDRRDGRTVIRLDDGPPVNFCRPAVDRLFVSAAEMCGNAAVAVILTGMGHDGTEGARAIAAAGGGVIAQDEATSVVWGMPGSAAQAGVCSAVLPLDRIGPKLVRVFAGESL